MKTFKNIKCVECYYHYLIVLRENDRDMYLLTKDNKESTELILKEFYFAPFKYFLDNNYLNYMRNHYIKEFNYMKKYFDYHKKQWFRYFEN